MRTVITAMIVALTLGLTSLSASAAAESAGGMQQITLAVKGMTCATCEPRLRHGLKRTGAVQEVSASMAEGHATITYDPDKIDIEGLIKAIERVGFRASRLET